MTVGGQGTVLPGSRNNIRSRADGSSTQLGQIWPGEVFTVTGNAVCAGGLQWWPISFNGISGWTAAGDVANQWIEPVWSGGSGSVANPTSVPNSQSEVPANPPALLSQNFTAPFTTCESGSTGSHGSSDPREVFAFGFSNAGSGCNSANGLLESRFAVWGGTDAVGSFPFQAASTFAHIEQSVRINSTGLYRIRVEIEVNGNLGVASGTSDALPDVTDAIGWLLQLGDAPSWLINGISSASLARAFLEANQAQGEVTTYLTIVGNQTQRTTESVAAPLMSNWPVNLSQSGRYNQTVSIQLDYQAVAGETINVVAGIQSYGAVSGWSSSFWNFRNQGSYVRSISLQQLN